MRCIVFLCPLLLIAALACSQSDTIFTVDNVPDPYQLDNGYVSDPANLLADTDYRRLNTQLRALADSTDVELLLVLLPSIGSEVPKDFATRLFERWQIGQAARDNGLLLLTVLDQRRTEVETGYGLEGLLPDAVIYRSLSEALYPAFQQGEFAEGLSAFAAAIREYLRDPAAQQELFDSPPSPSEESEGRGFWLFLQIYGGITLLLHFGLLLYIIYTLRNKEELYDKYRSLRRADLWPLLIFFPLPYLFFFIYLKRKLKALRYQRRFSRETGAPMHLLNEEEDDTYLERGQLMEEQLGSVDYDVWITEDSEDLLVLAYDRRFSSYRKCPECKYKTYIKTRTELIRRATYSHSGLKRHYYECKNCRYHHSRDERIPKKTRSGGAVSVGGISIGGGGGGRSRGGSSGGGGAGISW